MTPVHPAYDIVALILVVLVVLVVAGLWPIIRGRLLPTIRRRLDTVSDRKARQDWERRQ